MVVSYQHQLFYTKFVHIMKIRVKKGKTTMIKIKNKSKISTIFLILLLTLFTIVVVLQVTWAQENEPINIETQLWISATPNPIGINQMLAIMWWLSIPPPTATGVSDPRWEGFLLHFEKPDGSEDILGPFTSDANGGAFATYTPTQLEHIHSVQNFQVNG